MSNPETDGRNDEFQCDQKTRDLIFRAIQDLREELLRSLKESRFGYINMNFELADGRVKNVKLTTQGVMVPK